MTGSITLAGLWDAAQDWFMDIAGQFPGLAGIDAGKQAAGLLVSLAFLVALLTAVWIRGRRSRRSLGAGANGDLAALTRGAKRLGLVAAAVFVFVFGAWSIYAPLASAALAPGVISPDGYRRTVQHLEGGIIRAIHVREGDPVSAGDPLITLDDTAARSLDAEIRERYLHVLATEARLEAERTDAPEIVFPDVLLADDSPAMRQVIEGQRQLLASRRATLASRISILEARILQLGEQNAGLDQVIAAEEEQLALIDEEITAADDLLAQGLERKPRILALQRTRAEVAASIAMNRARIAQNAEAMGETRLQLLAVDEERREAIAGQLAEIRRVLAELRGQMPSRENMLERTVIRAPIAGRVMNLRATTGGGVIRPGEPIADIVPDEAHLMISARVQPHDIDRITPGMSARVILSAYNQRNMPQIHGRLQSISADAFVDERSGAAYFLAQIEVDPQDIEGLSHVQLVPGMPAEVMLLDGERSAMEYFLAPILESRRRSFLER
ncbi:HlyD family type I secretion periplasmic adaptor subunit [Tabrizicola caldifontis]|uniref:HlyD family type I secretion periplasmic adaptor subunit n=1 Tax=Tabrizicola caldifontis TaxID=2528036 RepID=UPI0010811FFE|nr:HlyD family type I secretion periplasmic adaptor subunit [Rhodobacter sp. YIM 73028]